MPLFCYEIQFKILSPPKLYNPIMDMIFYATHAVAHTLSLPLPYWVACYHLISFFLMMLLLLLFCFFFFLFTLQLATTTAICNFSSLQFHIPSCCYFLIKNSQASLPWSISVSVSAPSPPAAPSNFGAQSTPNASARPFFILRPISFHSMILQSRFRMNGHEVISNMKFYFRFM